jgi:hypothetical protein
MSVTKSEIKTLAKKLDGVDDLDEIGRLIGHLDEADQLAVLDRSDDIIWKQIAEIETRTVWRKELLRLAAASGCPVDAPIIPWLEERGLIEEEEVGDRVWRFKIVGPAVTQ